MKRIFLMTLTGVLLSSEAAAYLEDEVKETCEALGYKTTVSACLSAGGTPLLCPFYKTDNPLSLCMKQSCRGYHLKPEDLDKTASDGKTYRQHVKELSGCEVGFGEDKLTLYRIDSCLDGSLYQNGVCDVGCDKVNKYPYNSHPGNLAGNVISCVDKDGEYFGYDSCNDGWIWSAGRCNLASCAIQNYPYLSDPNLINNVNRGLVKTCKIGGNTYYRYTGVDENNKPLTSGGCGNNGYTLLEAVCAKKCNIGNCSSVTKTVTYTANGVTYNRSYKEWSCDILSADCRVGDYAVINNQMVGFIFHLPDATLKRTLIAADVAYKLTWGQNLGASTDTPLANSSSKAYFDGKYNTNFLLNFASSGTNYSYPAAEKTVVYTPSNCSHDICRAGEWYLPSLGELTYLFDNRYIMYNVVSSKDVYYPNFQIWSSQEVDAVNACFHSTGIIYCWPKTFGYWALPVMSFSPKS